MVLAYNILHAFSYCVIASHVQTDSCPYGDVRLVNGSDSSEDRLEICINGKWGTVCDDHWNDNNTDVVCRQVGDYSSGQFVH